MNYSDLYNAPLTPQTFSILLALLAGENHSYGIRQRVEDDSQGMMTLSDGTLYAALKRLMAQGLVTKDEDRVYELTPAGQSKLRGELQRLKAMVRRAETRFVAQHYGLSEGPSWR
ncbi:MAG TPA: PadR family transcriptional regulator [Candidatus Saccharimonadia bacterium]|nr:PadR family transcriptional regulator [Candidatus Saccharimonadia bacterium]